jgi:hypothetical protein
VTQILKLGSFMEEGGKLLETVMKKLTSGLFKIMAGSEISQENSYANCHSNKLEAEKRGERPVIQI